MTQRSFETFNKTGRDENQFFHDMLCALRLRGIRYLPDRGQHKTFNTALRNIGINARRRYERINCEARTRHRIFVDIANSLSAENNYGFQTIFWQCVRRSFYVVYSSDGTVEMKLPVATARSFVDELVGPYRRYVMASAKYIELSLRKQS